MVGVVIRILAVLDFCEHVPADSSQVYPLGQQCSPSLQQTAPGRGQHPHSRSAVLQHVSLSGHVDSPSGHTTL